LLWKEVITIGQHNTDLTEQKRTYSVVEIASILEISKKRAYSLCDSGCFKIVRIGRAIRVSKSSFDKWLDENK